MKRLLLLASIILLWASNAFAVGIWVTKYGDTYSYNKATTALADAYMTATGIGTLFPGTEGLSLPAYRPGVCYLWQRYDGYRVIGTPFEAWPAGVRQMRVDSLGVAAANVITARLGPASGPTSGGAIRIVDGVTFPLTGAGIQAAINDLPSRGGRVIVSADSIAFGSDTLLINKSYVTIEGAAERATVFSYTGSGRFIQLGADDASHAGTANAYDGTASGIKLIRLRLTGPGKTSTATAITDWESGSNTYQDLTIDSWGTGYFGLGADVSQFDRVYFSNNTYGMYLGSRCDQNTLTACYFAGNRFAFYDEWSYGFRIFGSQFVFSDSADVVIDSRSDPTQGADTRNGSQRAMISGCWFEPTTGSPPPRHLWLGRNGSSSLFLTGLTVTGCEFFSMDGEKAVQVDAFSDVQLIANGYSGSAFTFIDISSVSGITPKIDDLWNHMSGVVTRISGAGPVTYLTSIADSVNIRVPTEWRGSNGNIDIPTTGDRIIFTGSGANLLNASAGNLRLMAAGINTLEVNTVGAAVKNGQLFPNTHAFSQLGSPADGAIDYCSDCTKATPCASGGSGAIAVRINGAWDCNP